MKAFTFIIFIIFLFEEVKNTLEEIEIGVPQVAPKEDVTEKVIEPVPHSWPWMVRIENEFMSGSLIDKEWILTSSFKSLEKSPTFVYLGCSTIDCSDGQEFEVETVYYHPSYAYFKYDNDVALLKLAKGGANYTNNIIPICLTRYVDDVMKSKAYAFTASRHMHDASECLEDGFLKQLSTKFTDLSLCQEKYKYNESKFCVLSKNGYNLQYGAPLMVKDEGVQRWYQIGALSDYAKPGDAPSIYSRPNCDFVKDIIGREICDICPMSVPRTTTTEAPTTTMPKPQHLPRECPCAVDKLWLDIVLVIDSSNGISYEDFNALKSVLVGFINQIKISQTDQLASRLAIVNIGPSVERVSDLLKFKDNSEALNAVNAIYFQGNNNFDLGAGLVEAQKVLNDSDKRSNVRNLVIVFSSKNINCTGSSDDACNVIANMIANPLTTLLTVGLNVDGSTEFPLLTFGSPCFSTVNDVVLQESLVSLACKANCFCQSPYVQFSNEEECHLYGECVNPKGFNATYSIAQSRCREDSAALVNIFSDEKQNFVRETATSNGLLPYWLGLQRGELRYVWDSGDILFEGDYTNWARNEPNITVGSCVYVKQGTGFSFPWYMASCAADGPNYAYLCQKKTCDTENYC